MKPSILVLNDSPYAMAALPFLQHELIRLPIIHSVAPDEVELALTNPEWRDKVVAVSDFVAKTLPQNQLGSGVIVCESGVHIPAPNRRQQRERRQSRMQIISAGRIVVYQKRMDRLPTIAKMLAEKGVDYHWTVLGDGDYLPQLWQELVRLGLQDHFSLKGAVPHSAVASALDEADVFVMPSDCEGLPQALLEAMAHGVVPVVSRILGSTTCVVEDGMCGYLCEPSKSDEFANAIAKLVAQPAFHLAMGVRAAETIARRFSVEAFTGRFLTIISDLRSQVTLRPQALSLSVASSWRKPFRCLGFWRNLRHQSLGRLKRRFLRMRSRATHSASLTAF